MANNDYLRQTLEHYRQQRQAQLDELRKTEALIAHFEKELGEASSLEPGQPAASLDYSTVSEARTAPSRTVEIQPDDFYGMTQTQAAKAYLLRVKRAVSIDQIVDALRRGGAQLGGADPKKTLYVSLARNPQREFVIPQEGYFGLREFYPTLPKSVSKPKNSKSKKSRARKHRTTSKKSRVHGAATKSDEDKSDKPIKTAVQQFVRNSQSATLEEIVAGVEKQLGRKIAALGVRSTLRGKEFIKDGDSYSLAK